MRTLLSFSLADGQLAYVTLFVHLVARYQLAYVKDEVRDFRAGLNGLRATPNLYHVLSNLVKTMGFIEAKTWLSAHPYAILSLWKRKALHEKLLATLATQTDALKKKSPHYRRLMRLLMAADQLLVSQTVAAPLPAHTPTTRSCLSRFKRCCCGNSRHKHARTMATRTSEHGYYSSGGDSRSQMSVSSLGDVRRSRELDPDEGTPLSPEESAFLRRHALAFITLPSCCIEQPAMRRCLTRLWLACCHRPTNSSLPHLALSADITADPLRQRTAATRAVRIRGLLAQGAIDQLIDPVFRSAQYMPYQLPSPSAALTFLATWRGAVSREHVAYVYAGMLPTNITQCLTTLPAGRVKDYLYAAYLADQTVELNKSYPLNGVRLTLAIKADAKQYAMAPADPLLSRSIPLLILALLRKLTTEEPVVKSVMSAYLGDAPTASDIMKLWHLSLSATAPRPLNTLSVLSLNPLACLESGHPAATYAPLTAVAASLYDAATLFLSTFSLPEALLADVMAAWHIQCDAQTNTPLPGLFDHSITAQHRHGLPQVIVYHNPLVKQCLYSLALLHYRGKLQGTTATTLLRLIVENLHDLSDPAQNTAVSFPVQVQQARLADQGVVDRCCFFLWCCGRTDSSQTRHLRWRITERLLVGMLQTLSTVLKPAPHSSSTQASALLPQVNLAPLRFALESTRRDLATQDTSNRVCAFFKRHPLASGVAGAIVGSWVVFSSLYNLTEIVPPNIKTNATLNRAYLIILLCAPAIIIGNKLIHRCRLNRVFAQLSRPEPGSTIEDAVLKAQVNAL